MGEVIERRKIDELLDDEETVESLTYILSSLPEYVERLKKLDKTLLFLESVMQDKESLQNIAKETEEAIQSLNVGKESFDAVIELTKMLPVITPYLSKAVELAEFGRHTLNDKESFNSVKKDLEPYLSAVHDYKDILEETTARAREQKPENISIFKIFALLKEPVLKQGFHYVRTFLTVINERK